MINNKYQPINVLNNRKLDLEDHDAIAEVAAMINGTASSRAQRRRLEKTLNKISKVQAKCEQVARAKANKEIAIRSDNNFMYVFACVGITLFDDYHWTNGNEHGQIESFYERLTKKMDKLSEEGYSTEDIINLLEDKTGVRLISDPQNLEI